MLKEEIPVIVFSKGANSSLEKIGETGAAAVGVDWTVPIDEAATKIGRIVQGNLDPGVLFANPEVIVKEAKKIMEDAPKGRHIFNLGHGILPNTPVDNVRRLVEFVKAWRVD